MSAKIFQKKGFGRKELFTLLPEGDKPLPEPMEIDTPPAEMSIMEKQIMECLLPMTPPLPYPRKVLKMAYGADSEEYVLPSEERVAVLQQLYPFVNCPGLDDVLYDIHQKRCFKAGEYRVIRERGRNMLVSPDYPNTGGMVVDWVDLAELEAASSEDAEEE